MFTQGIQNIKLNYLCRQSFVIHKTAELKRLKKREYQRLKSINVWDPEYTGEPPVHKWMDAKKIKALAAYYQTKRNQHRFTFKLETKDKLKLKEIMTKFSEEMYLRRIQEDYWLTKHAEITQNVWREIGTLPFLLKEELLRKLTDEEKEENYHPLADQHEVNIEQILRLMPESRAHNYELARRLDAVQADKLTQGE